MKSTNKMIHSAVASAIALCSLTGAGQVYAAHENEEKCAGIVRAGQNDCATSQTSCHGSISVDQHPMAWIYVPKLAPDEVKPGQ